METTVKLYTLGYSRVKTYVTALLFVAGNIVLPQLFHLVPQGGVTWLPIYFFTLVGAYKYGWKAGLLTAVLSPLLNSWWFGMPAPAVLPTILLKSVLLAVGAGLVAARFRKVTLPLLLGVVLYLVISQIDLSDLCKYWKWIFLVGVVCIGIPGMLLQVLGGYWVIRRI